MENQTELKTNNPKSEQEQSVWEKIKYLLNHKEVGEALKLARQVILHERKWSYLIETLVTLLVAGFLVWSLIYLVDNKYIDKGSFGVMFGTVFGYLLSWRFGK